MISIRFLCWLKSLYFDQRLIWHKRNYARLASSGKILDVGCGRGDFALIAPERIIGLDYNKHSLYIAKERGVHYLVCADALRLPFRDQSFENVHCADLIEHFTPGDVVTLLEELYRVLQKKGILLISSPMPTKEFWGDPSHVRPYPPESLTAFFIPDKEKGLGTNPTFRVIGKATLVGVYWRYRPLCRLPYQLQTDEQRRKVKNLPP